MVVVGQKRYFRSSLEAVYLFITCIYICREHLNLAEALGLPALLTSPSQALPEGSCLQHPETQTAVKPSISLMVSAELCFTRAHAMKCL